MSLSNTSLISSANLVAYWKMDGNGNDSKGSNTLTTSNLTYNSSIYKYVQSADFNGSNSQAYSQSSSFAFSGSANFSYSFWIKLKSLPATGKRYRVVMIQAGADSGTYDKGFIINPDGQVQFYVYSGGAKYASSSTGLVSANNWYHFVGCFNGSSAYFYVDNTNRGTVSASSTYGETTPRLVLSLTTSDANDLSFNGYIDDFAVFNRVLTTTEIAEIYNNQDLKTGFFMLF